MNYIGKTFNKWTIISDEGNDKKNNKLCKAQCECGVEKIHRLYTIIHSKSTQCKSCGLKQAQNVSNIINQKFNNWLVLSRSPNDKKNNTSYLCKCDCGNIKNISGYRLRNFQTLKCSKCRNITHGKSYTKTYKIWSDMKRRCEDPNMKSYMNYGGRGITVCKRWSKFENFLEDMGEKPNNLSLDRIDNECGYEPINCRWATLTEQRNNQRPPKKYNRKVD